jgi:hypothetical protein
VIKIRGGGGREGFLEDGNRMIAEENTRPFSEWDSWP